MLGFMKSSLLFYRQSLYGIFESCVGGFLCMLGFVKSVWKVPMCSSRGHVQDNAMGLWGSRSAYSGEPYIESFEVLEVYSTKV